MFKGLVLLVGFIEAAPLSWQPTVANCTERWLRQDRDHFSFSVDANPGKFDQRSELGAMLVFAEHRYYGESLVYPNGTPDCKRYLTIEQALGDYSVLIDHIFAENSLPPSTATIAFGGSYGGMLASAFRYRYPHLVDGAIASSAPIFAIGGVTPEPSMGAFSEIVEAFNLKATLKLVEELGPSQGAWQGFKDEADRFWRLQYKLSLHRSVIDPLGGNYPYPSNYFTGGHGYYPANPIRTACAPFEQARTDKDRLRALAESLNIYYNASGNAECVNATKMEFHYPNTCEGDYSFQECTQMPWGFHQGTENDMFWPTNKFDMDSYKADCKQIYGVTTRARASLQFVRNMADAVASMSNVVFTNGKFDPWFPSRKEKSHKV
ncbi:hypothetical protein FOL47_005227 [Perkinsus chesapeaki]|uniref:Thymus-specific serine protease n=1 Tax=Perkinsus chesapeaki TaxID=330153 RepID=A0A7J6LZ67_PERCH|nr:hypothetical protein FOL47_005227 [Perkinsus chesapeaki]